MKFTFIRSPSVGEVDNVGEFEGLCDDVFEGKFEGMDVGVMDGYVVLFPPPQTQQAPFAVNSKFLNLCPHFKQAFVKVR